MKPLLFLLTGITLITVAGCSTSSPTSPASGRSGSVAFKLDKTTIPQGVMTVEAILTRSGYDSVTASADVQTDTSAILQMSGLEVGQWHLTVNATDGSGNILYTGEAGVTISAGVTTDVSLTLEPVSRGTGSVLITVNWGNGGVSFVDYSGNPVLTPSQNPSSVFGVAAGRVLVENGTYKMWYVGVYNWGAGNIWYAESRDGTSWNTVGSSPVLQPSPDSTSWDSYEITLGAVIDEGGSYYMYYGGTAGQYNSSNESTGLATSSDGITWTKHGTPVLAAAGSDYSKVIINTVVKMNGVYYAYYDNHPMNGAYEGINLATSTDGVNWENYSGNPVLKASLPWEDGGIGCASVVQNTNGMVMVYQNALGDKIGMATSQDGYHWTKMSEYVFSSGQTTGGKFNTHYTNLIYDGNGQYRLYYTSNLPDGSLVICMAEYDGDLP